MIAAGANPLELAEQLGHMDAQLVFKGTGICIPERPPTPRCSLMT
jgi:hypothetical protein